MQTLFIQYPPQFVNAHAPRLVGRVAVTHSFVLLLERWKPDNVHLRAHRFRQVAQPIRRQRRDVQLPTLHRVNCLENELDRLVHCHVEARRVRVGDGDCI
jgi:hypothetical protein